jgi:NAD(P)-dependent dehydrogenase (short-subunit alcohol dehydrogenase family)
MDNNFQGKVVVITGASSGLGEGTARLLSERGADVVLGARRANPDRPQHVIADRRRLLIESRMVGDRRYPSAWQWIHHLPGRGATHVLR